ncbi:MAG: ribosome-associated translation inhibitor RaiA [Candidatus Taylorbacteria bacterium]|nr:ribosome-associated translation inhibitor RaiA [Candidatus Taylorbacteria bacterium]
MRVNTPKATNITLTDDILRYLGKKLEGFRRLVPSQDESVLLDVELARTTLHHRAGEIYRAELTLTMSGRQLRSEAERADIYSAIDAAKDELAENLSSSKDKKMSLLRRSGVQIKNFLKGIYELRPRRWLRMPRFPRRSSRK